MKERFQIIKKYGMFLGLLLFMDGFFILMLWIMDVEALVSLSGLLLLGSLLLFTGMLGVIIFREQRRREAFAEFLYAPSELSEEKLKAVSSEADYAIIALLGKQLRQQQLEKQELLARTRDYEEYVEVWAHETKTPISLLSMVLDNRREEIPENVVLKLDYIRNSMEEYVNQMLFYARLKGEKKDYLLESIDLVTCIQDILQDYQALLEEKQFQIQMFSGEATVYSDRRGLGFLLSQIISNAVKYTDKERQPQLSITWQEQADDSVLSIKDNGVGVRESDLPYIFEKGFTGDTGENRKRATGMGLYLAKEIAKDLKLDLEVASTWGSFFEMQVHFPKIE